MIRTLVEIRGGRVNVQERDGQTTVTIEVDGELSTPLLPGERLYTAAEVASLQWRAEQNREWAERAEVQLVKMTTAHEQGEDQILRMARQLAEMTTARDEAQAQAAVAENSRDEMDRRRKAAWNRAEDLEARLVRMTTVHEQAEDQILRMVHRLTEVKKIVDGHLVRDAMGFSESVDIAGNLMVAINRIRTVLGAPDTDAPSTSET